MFLRYQMINRVSMLEDKLRVLLSDVSSKNSRSREASILLDEIEQLEFEELRIDHKGGVLSLVPPRSLLTSGVVFGTTLFFFVFFRSKSIELQRFFERDGEVIFLPPADLVRDFLAHSFRMRMASNASGVLATLAGFQTLFLGLKSTKEKQKVQSDEVFADMKLRVRIELRNFEEKLFAEKSSGHKNFSEMPGLVVVHVASNKYSLYLSVFEGLRHCDVNFSRFKRKADFIQFVRDKIVSRLCDLISESPRDVGDSGQPSILQSDLVLEILSSELNFSFIVRNKNGEETSYGDLRLPTLYLRYNAGHYDTLIPELSLVWQGKYRQPVYALVAERNELGSSLKAHYSKEKTKPGKSGRGRVWVGKYGGGTAPVSSGHGTGTKIHLHHTRSGVREFIGSGFYKVFSEGRYGVAKTRLTYLPVSNRNTDRDERTSGLLGLLGRGRDYQSIHLMSKIIEGYQDLRKLEYCYASGRLQIFEECLRDGIIPEKIRIDETDFPLSGVLAMLAVSKVIGDIDVLGGSGANAGFTIKRVGDAVTIMPQKIDPGYAFTFNVMNAFYSQNRFLNDRRDIQYGTAGNSSQVIKWAMLTGLQQDEFLETLDSMIVRFQEAGFLDYMLCRDNVFIKAENIWPPSQINSIKTQMEENMGMLIFTYNDELTSYRSRRHDRDCNNLRFFVPRPRVLGVARDQASVSGQPH